MVVLREGIRNALTVCCTAPRCVYSKYFRLVAPRFLWASCLFQTFFFVLRTPIKKAPVHGELIGAFVQAATIALAHLGTFTSTITVVTKMCDQEMRCCVRFLRTIVWVYTAHGFHQLNGIIIRQTVCGCLHRLSRARVLCLYLTPVFYYLKSAHPTLAIRDPRALEHPLVIVVEQPLSPCCQSFQALKTPSL